MSDGIWLPNAEFTFHQAVLAEAAGDTEVAESFLEAALNVEFAIKHECLDIEDFEFVEGLTFD